MSAAILAVPLAIEALNALVTLEANTPQALALAQSAADLLASAREGTATPGAAAHLRRVLDAIRDQIDCA